MKGTVHYSKQVAQGGKTVAVLTMDNAPMNPLSSGVRTGLDTHLKEALGDSSISAIVVTGAKGAFCAGADISEFSAGMKGASLMDVIANLEGSSKPVIAAVDGVSLGGGLEVALSCHYRVASQRAVAGLPEVNLGLLPGAGGTQRMPRLIGAEASMDFINSGVPLQAKAAQKAGIYDTVVEGDSATVLKAAVDFAASKVGSDLGPRRLSTLSAKPVLADVTEAKQKMMKASRPGELAPQAIIRCIQAATDRPFVDGMHVEQEEFVKLMKGDQSKALQYMFFAERECAKVPGLKEKSGALDVAGVVGAGLMGGGIAMCCAEAGMRVFILDIDAEALKKGMAVIQKNYARSVERKSKTQAQVDKIMSLIVPTSKYSDLAPCDIVVEAVFENMAVKKNIFKSFDEVCKPSCILASNTSGLNIDEIAAATKRPESVIGCHFFSPANVMKLLENVRGSKSSPRTIATAMAFGKKLKKVTCLVGNCPGFVANRIMQHGVDGPPGSEIVGKGYMPHEVDSAAEAFGMKMGPYRMNDVVGLDLFGRERENRGVADPANVVPDALYAAGRFGQKNGKGFYKYDDKRKMSRDPAAEEIIAKVWKNSGVTPRDVDANAIVQELYFPVINEGFKILEEGMASRASDIDVCLVFGYNWPRYRGGPMQYATAVGLPMVLQVLEKMGEAPAELLKLCVKNNWTLNSKEFKQHLASKSKL